MITRLYQGFADLPLMTAFAATNMSLRGGCSYWHPGDIVWMIYTHSHMNLFDNRYDIRLWLDDFGVVVGLAWFYSPTTVRFDIHPNHYEELGREVLNWVESHTPATSAGAKRRRLFTDVQDNDEQKIESLKSSGFTAMEGSTDVLCRDLSTMGQEQPAPDGLTVHDCVDVDEHVRAACHRDAWSSLGHIGRPDQVSSFHDHIYHELRSAHLYDPSLDLVVATSDGELAACCIAWSDEISRFGHFEPMGTRPAYRGLRLSALLLESAMHRLKEKGMKYAYVGSSEKNNPTAYKSYRRVFDPIGKLLNYRKDLS
jgi:mycothiol synthase